MDAAEPELVLANRQFLWGLVARGFAEEPDEVFADILAGEHAQKEVSLLKDEFSDGLAALYARMVACFAEEGGLARVRAQYVQVFVGPGVLEASPWETMHLTGSRVLFQRGVLGVRDAYRQAGFLPERYRAVSDDAIGLECDFMAKLAVRAALASSVDDDEALRERLLQAREFLVEHLLRWIDSLAEAIAVHYGADVFYAELARFTSLWCQRDRRVLDVLLEG